MSEPNPPTGGVALITAGDPGRRTGGNEYNRRVLGYLDRRPLPGIGPVWRVLLAEAAPEQAAEELGAALEPLHPRLVVVDSIALAPAALRVEWIKDRLGARILALMHMRPSDLYGEGDAAGIIPFERRLLSAADRVVAVSPALADRLIAAGSPPNRTVVILPGRDATGVAASPRSPIPGPRPPVRFLCVANWSESKGVHLVVEALARLSDRDAALDLVGDTPDAAYMARVRQRIARLGLEERVRVYGPLPPERLAERYTAADVFVLPSRSEGFGIVYAEAMSHGLPILAARVGPLPWLVEDGTGLLLPPGDVDALARAMDRLAADPELRRCLGQGAWRRAQRLPTWEESAARFQLILRELIEPIPAARVGAAGRPR